MVEPAIHSKRTPRKGRLIVFEGVDGSGTTYISKWLVEAMNAHDIPAYWTCGPSSLEIGRLARQVPPISNRALASLYVTDRYDQEDRVILPEMEKGKVVVCDRYVWSSLAYQSKWLNLDWLHKLNFSFIVPDITLLLDASLDVTMARLSERDITDSKYESYSMQEFVRKQYKYLYEACGENYNAVVINSSLSKDEVKKLVWDSVQERIV